MLRPRSAGRLLGLAAASALASSLLVLGAPSASADVCGYTGEDDGYSNKAQYLNCSAGLERIRIDYTYASEEVCVSPGRTPLFANPDLGAVRNAIPLGPC